MKRLAPFAAALVLAVLPLFAVVPAASAVPASVPQPAAAVSCDQGDKAAFTFQSYDADFTLTTDADGRSVLKTVETFVADFPAIDQNQGMRRAIPGSYQGAPVDVTIDSVTDGQGNPRPFTTDTDDEGFVLVTSRADECVHGLQTYVFTYTQHNVTRYFANTNDDELYWDTNGTGWDQPFLTATSRFHVPTELAASLNDQNACYRGPEGSTTPCQLQQSEDAQGAVFTTTEQLLAPGENVTVVLGFEPKTFVPRDDRFFSSPYAVLQLISVGGSIIALIWAIVLRRTRFADGRGRPTIIAEYTPPTGLDPITAAVILKKTQRAAAAAFIDLAVTRKIRVIETENTGWFAKGSTYTLELVDPSGLAGPELTLATALFGPGLQVGTQYVMTGKDVALSQSVRSIIKAATTATVTSGLRKKGLAKHAALPNLLVVASGIGSVFFGVLLMGQALGGGIPFLLIVPSVIAFFVVIGLLSRTPLTAEGAELRDHLKGLELFIRVAEADRLRMLQSPTGALKEPVAGGAAGAPDAGQIVKIYEKLLPYAVLFNLEKQWAEELGKYYVDSSPDYYSGSGVFNAAIFATSIGSLSTSAATSYSGSSSSSSSGGSGGGGSSGGGGGGGGGGGV